MGKTDEKLGKLRDIFISGATITIREICDQLGINRSRAYDYIKILSDQGLSFETKQFGHKVIYSLEGTVPVSSLYNPLSKKDVIIYRIISCLSTRPMVAEDLYKGYFSGTIPQSSFYNIINELIRTGQLTETIKYEYSKKTDGGRKYKRRYLSPSGLYNSLIINVDIEGQNLINAYVASGQSQSAALRRLREKMAVLLGDNSVFSIDESIFLQYGRGFHMGDNFQKYYHLLMDNHFRTNVLDFDYREKHIRFYTGMVVYSQDKDMIYLLGRIARAHNCTILKASDISNLSHLDWKNSEYGLSKYNDYLQNMFSISIEDPQNVEVSFDDTPANLSRLKRLCKLRTNGSLTHISGHLIYTDVISGLNDFAVYLRSFGESYTVNKPALLKEMQKKTIDRTLSRYTKQDNE